MSETAVLVIDDEPDVRELCAEMLERLGFHARVASEGREALEWAVAHEGPIAAVLLDIALPEMSGCDIARELRRIRPDTPIVLMSGFQESYARSQLPEDLELHFLPKPFGREDLAHAIGSRTSPR